jgi:hypothetical protein
MEEIDMPEVRVQLSNDLMDTFRKQLGDDLKPTQVTQDALALYDWAVRERAAGRVILSSEPNGTNSTQITTPSLMKISSGS